MVDASEEVPDLDTEYMCDHEGEISVNGRNHNPISPIVPDMVFAFHIAVQLI